ncbi:hypothetical protein TIFTF001_032035 [Ficus carica]|uniref:Uncharacterized protein n=1 Tax=Ficus carica TaxID=3494 RepID=A0AA88DWP1_FICCA|nr:hypothetical protein TIFTF001_032035 [Ficus carica]
MGNAIGGEPRGGVLWVCGFSVENGESGSTETKASEIRKSMEVDGGELKRGLDFLAGKMLDTSLYACIAEEGFRERQRETPVRRSLFK